MFDPFRDAHHQALPTPEQALPGRTQPQPVPPAHRVLGQPPFPAHLHVIQLGMGCFWGAERKYWQQSGVHTTAVGYAGGFTPHPTYEEVCSGRTGHTEVVQVVFDPAQFSLHDLLRIFWESHDPTQGMRQGNDRGTQYRSAIYFTRDDQQAPVERSRQHYQQALQQAGHGPITTEIKPAGPFYFAEPCHQQYLAKNPGGYCGLRGTGVRCL